MPRSRSAATQAIDRLVLLVRGRRRIYVQAIKQTVNPSGG
jgi:hypothetical protein